MSIIGLKKLYYQYVDKATINQYRLWILTEEYRDTSDQFFQKYTKASNWSNVNEELYKEQPESKIDYDQASKKQQELVDSFFLAREKICNDCENNSKDFFVCSQMFQTFYADKKYNYKQTPDAVITGIKTDIIKHNL